MKDLSSRPTIAKKLNNMEDYDTIFLGFPIWWYIAPTIINTFLESYDLSNKTIVVFATSGGSKLGKTIDHLKGSCLNANLVESDVLSSNMTKEEIIAWVKTLNI